MADRQGVPQYNVNFNPAMIQQAQQHMRNQQAAQQQNMGFQDLQQRMWQQTQLRSQQQQQQQQAQGMSDQQMTELLRNQNMARLQAQQQQQAGNFMGMQGGNPASANHPQGFPNQNMAQIPPGFPNNMQNGMHPQQTRSPGMQHVMQNSQSHARQLELMGMAQNQQNQNINFRPGVKPQGSPQPAPHPGNFPRPGSVPGQQPDMFTPGLSDDTVRRGSPAEPNMPPMNPQQVQIYQRARYTKQLVVETEKHIQDLNNARAGMSDQLYHTRMNTLSGELRQRNDLYHKFQQLHTAAMKGMNVNPQLMNAIQMNPAGSPAAWIAQTGIAQTTPTPDMRSPQMRNLQTSPNMAAQLPIASPDLSSSHRVTTPQQPMNNGNIQMSAQRQYGQPAQPPSAANLPNVKGPISSLPFPAPLDKARFDATFASFRENQKIQIDERLLTIENRPIELYPLHVLTFQAGGFNAVGSKDQWATIGGRMGFVHFPANGNEPARSGPGVASMLENAYKMYLLDFETAYVNSQQNIRMRMQQQQQQQQQAVATQFATFSMEQQNALLTYARKPSDELRKTGVSEKVIGFVDQNRAYLQKLGGERGMFPNRPGNNNTTSLPPQIGQSPGGQQPQNAIRAPGQPNQNPAVQNMINLATAVGIPHPQLGQAYKWCQERKAEFISRVSTMPSVDIPVERRAEYNELFAMLNRLVADLDDKIPLFFVMTKDTERVRRLLGITTTVGQQQSLLSQLHSSNNVRYLISAESVKEMLPQVQHALEHFMTVYQQFRSGRIGQSSPSQQPMLPGNRPPGPSPNPIPGRNLPPQPVPQQMPPPAAHHNAPAIPNHPRVNLQPPPVGGIRKASGSSPAQTNDVSASTPAAAATPSQSQSAPSPSTPKSPKAKTKAKAIPKPARKPVKATPAQTPSETVPEPTNSNGMAALSAATAEQVNAGVKRAREEDLAAVAKSEPKNSPLPLVNDEQGPSKRMKSEWDGPADEALLKKTEAVENVKTEEDATSFLEQMSELLRSAVTDGDESTAPNLSDTLDMILKGYNSMPDAPEGSTSASHTADTNSASVAAAMASADEFFDFSSFIDDDESASKADTPDLVPSSSTNPSPESEADPAHHHSPLHGFEDHDPLALGTFKEIDGGETAYYQATDWKWEGSMPSVDWAVFPS